MVWFYATVRSWAHGPYRTHQLDPQPVLNHGPVKLVHLSSEPIWDFVFGPHVWNGKKTRRLTMPEAYQREKGLVRVRVRRTPDQLIDWKTARKMLPPLISKKLEVESRERYGNLRSWFFSKSALPREDWGEVEFWTGLAWRPTKDPVVLVAYESAVGSILEAYKSHDG